MEDKYFELMFSDLKAGAQEALLAFMNEKSAEDLNWDICPIAIIERKVDE